MLCVGDKSSPKDLKLGKVVQKTSKFSVLSVKSKGFLGRLLFKSDFIIDRYLTGARIFI